MAELTEGTVRSSKQARMIELKVDTVDTVYAGGFIQSQEDGVDVIPVGTASVGAYLGIARDTKTSPGTATVRKVQINCGPEILDDSTITGASTAKIGYPVYVTTDNDLTHTYATGAKYMGISVIDKDTIRPMDLGLAIRAGIAATPIKREYLGALDASDLDVGILAAMPVYVHGQRVTKFGIRIQSATDVQGSMVLGLYNGTTQVGTAAATVTADSTAGTALNAEISVAVTASNIFSDGETIGVGVVSTATVYTAGKVLPFYEYEGILG